MAAVGAHRIRLLVVTSSRPLPAGALSAGERARLAGVCTGAGASRCGDSRCGESRCGDRGEARCGESRCGDRGDARYGKSHCGDHGASRCREWRTSRRALRLLLAVLGMPPDTAGYAFPHPRISLSHTPAGSAAAGAISGPAGRGWAPAGTGVDLEHPRPVDPRTARFFLRDGERSWLSRVPPPARDAEHLRLWTVKEALFKADPRNGRTTLRDYALDEPAARTGLAWAPAGRRLAYTSTRLGQAHLSIAAALPGARTHPRTDHPETHPETHRDIHTETKGSAMTMPTGPTSPTSPTITFEAVADRLSALLSVPAGELTPRTALPDFAGDSFELVEIVIHLQEEFGVTFTQAELRTVHTLGDLVEVLRAQERSRAGQN